MHTLLSLDVDFYKEKLKRIKSQEYYIWQFIIFITNYSTNVFMHFIGLSLLAYGLPKETVAAITILYRNTKMKVRSPDGDTEYFDIAAGVQQGDTLAPYLFIICLDYVLRTLIEKNQRKWLQADEEKKQKVPPQKPLQTPTTPMI